MCDTHFRAQADSCAINFLSASCASLFCCVGNYTVISYTTKPAAMSRLSSCRRYNSFSDSAPSNTDDSHRLFQSMPKKYSSRQNTLSAFFPFLHPQLSCHIRWITHKARNLYLLNLFQYSTAACICQYKLSRNQFSAVIL